MKKVAIIGCGASGLMCALVCAKAGLSVDIYEQNVKCGKKILISGNGHCNITNTSLHVNDFETGNKELLQVVLEEFGYKKFVKFMESLGFAFSYEEDGRVFPASKEAKSVVEFFVFLCKSYGVEIFSETKVTHIDKNLCLHVKDQKRTYDAVVVATGSKARSNLGGSESGYELSKFFGHSITPLYPSLVQFLCHAKELKKLSGIRLEAEVSLYVNSEKYKTTHGDILFTNYGLSGLSILDLSLEGSKALVEGGYIDIEVDLLYKTGANEFAKKLFNRAKQNPHLDIQTLLHVNFPQKLVLVVLEVLKIDPKQKIDMKLAKKIAYKLSKWKFEIEDTKGFEYAEVCGGGVDTNEIKPYSFESKKQEGLYIVGEVLDVVGKRGGYNFAFAWGSGYLAACDIIRKSNPKGR